MESGRKEERNIIERKRSGAGSNGAGHDDASPERRSAEKRRMPDGAKYLTARDP
jgi:hypothetical protein